jgi:vancomycin resistance protein VanJ
MLSKTMLINVLTTLIVVYAVGLVAYLILRVAFGDRWWWLAMLNNFAPLYFVPLVILLLLAALLRAQQIVMLLPLALVGLVWFGPYFVPKRPAPASSATLRVLTYNVWGNNHDLHAIESWVREVNADLVLLQEISPAYARDSLPGLRDVYPYQFAQPDDSRWGGNIALSRYPILTMDYLGSTNAHGQRLVVEINGQPISVYNVHLAFPVGRSRVPSGESFYMRVAFGYDPVERNQQIESLLSSLDAETNPFIVGGDFNTTEHTVIYTELAARMTDSFREAGWGLGASWPVSRARGMPAILPPVIRIDYIWHSDHFRAVEVQQGPPLGSDHLALLTTLEMLPAS